MAIEINGDTGISGVNGSATTPAIQGTDTNTGLTFGTDTVGVVTGGTTALTVDSSQRLGIGTTSPTVDSGNGIHIHNSTESAIHFTNSTVGTTSTDGAYIGYNSNALLLRNTELGATIRFQTYDSERARIDGSGRLLIGTSTGRSNFFNLSLTALQQIESTDSPRIAVISSSDVGGRGGALILAHQRSGTIGGNTVLNSGDNIGIVSFQGNDGTEFVIGASIEALVDGTPGANDMPGRLVFSTTADGSSSPTERVRITSAGYFKASNTGTYQASTGTFHEIVQNLSGNSLVNFRHSHSSSPFGNIIHFSAASPNNTGSPFWLCKDSTTTRGELRSNGGLANYSSNNANLCDEREKKNIVNLDSTWDCLKHWELKKFHYNEDDDSDDLRYGVIAQQVANYCPEVITDWVKQRAEDAVLDDDGNEVEPAKEEIVRMGVKEQQMMWMAIKALQEAQTRIEQLETRVAQLEGGTN